MKQMAERQLERVDLVLLPARSKNTQGPAEQGVYVLVLVCVCVCGVRQA